MQKVRWWKKPKHWEAELLNLVADCKDLLSVLKRMAMDEETRQLRAKLRTTGATSHASFALSDGPAMKPSGSSLGTRVALTENQQAILTPIATAIMACIKSTPSTPPVWDLTWDGSSILLRMSQSPTNSGSNEAGNRGPAPHTEPSSESSKPNRCTPPHHYFAMDSWVCDCNERNLRNP